MSFLRKYALSILFCIVASIGCFMDLSEVPKLAKTDLDKLIHMGFGFILSILIFFENTSYFRKRISYTRIVMGSFLFPILFGGYIEIGQEYLTTYRTGDWMDFLYNGAGAFLGFAACLVINGKLKITSSAQ
jgi:hypothetical protein